MSTDTTTTTTVSVDRYPAFVDLDGAEVDIVARRITGSGPGPRLAFVAAMHGCEWFGVRAAMAIIDRVSALDFSGEVVVIPVANPIAFASGTRSVRDEADWSDMNRAFGVRHAWPACQLANTLADNVLATCDAVIDLHSGPWGSTMDVVACASDYSKDGLTEETFRLASAFGTRFVQVSPMVGGFPGPTSLAGYVGEQFGIPVVAAEVGGSGFEPELEQAWEDANVDGVLNVMAALGMLAERPRPPAPERVGRAHRVGPHHGGMLRPVIPASRLMDDVAEGELLGELWNPYTFEVIEEFRVPCAGVLGMASAAGPLRPGHWAYIVFERTAPD